MKERASTELRAANDTAPPTTRGVRWLIALNVSLYFLQLTAVSTTDVQQTLGFQSRNVGHAWWTALTFMFVHANAWHLAFNMFVLWLFGPHVEWRWGTREFVRFYLFAGLGGWIAHLTLVGGDQVLMGASAPVLGVLAAYASMRTNTRAVLFGMLPVTSRWLTVLVGVTMVSGSILAVGGADSATEGAYLAHLGGFFAALLYLRISSTVDLQALRESVSPVPDEPDDVPPRAVPRAAPRTRAREHENIDDVVARTNAAVVNRPPSRQVVEEPMLDEGSLDKMLDKISAHGIDSLSREERQLLDEASRRLRDS